MNITNHPPNNLRTRFENGEEVVTVAGHTGVLINKREIENFRGPIPLHEYPINDDPNPIIVPKKCEQAHHATQEITVRYLEPPPLPPPGEIIIQHEGATNIPPAPPIVIRTRPPMVQQKEALVIREAPPKIPPPIPRKVVRIIGPKVLPPRKVIIEKPPPISDKAQAIIIERWLAPKIQPRRVVFDGTVHHQVQHAPVRNEIHECEAPNVVVNKQVKDLGVSRMDPNEYWTRYGNTLIESRNLPDFARDLRAPPGQILASDVRPEHYIPALEGDIQYLSNIDLQREGLSEYSSYVRSGGYSSSTSTTGGSTTGFTTINTGGYNRPHNDYNINTGSSTNYYDRSSSSPPRGVGSVIRTVVDSANRVFDNNNNNNYNNNNYQGGGGASSSAVYKSSTTNSHSTF